MFFDNCETRSFEIHMFPTMLPLNFSYGNLVLTDENGIIFAPTTS